MADYFARRVGRRHVKVQGFPPKICMRKFPPEEVGNMYYVIVSQDSLSTRNNICDFVYISTNFGGRLEARIYSLP